MRTNRSALPPTVVPVLVYPDVRAAVAFPSAAFGFVERTRIGENHRAQPAVGEDGALIVVDVGAGRRPPQAGGFADLVRVRVGDVEAAFTCACERGATVLEAPVDREFGERECTLEDGGGHIWNLAEAMVNAAPEEIGCETVSQWPAYKAS
ncbi:MAG: glyoxalase [Actinomycetota bacterium]|nr:glyoxalase [Actinomycetota bacterium]